ncbi:MAG: hypothetical protein R2849_22345 [Thermomicrobiales bacterium]
MRVAWSVDLGYAEARAGDRRPDGGGGGEVRGVGLHRRGSASRPRRPVEIVDIFFAMGQAGPVADRLDEVGHLLDQGRLKMIEHTLDWRAVDSAGVDEARRVLGTACPTSSIPTICC